MVSREIRIHGFEPKSSQTNDYGWDKDQLAQNQDNVTEWNSRRSDLARGGAV